MAKKKLTKEELIGVVEKIVEYETKMKALQEEYSKYRKIFRLGKKDSINHAYDLIWPVRDNLDCNYDEAENISADIFREILKLSNDPDLAFINVENYKYDYVKNRFIPSKYRDVCIKCLMDYPDRIFKLLEKHLYNIEYNTKDRFLFNNDELDIVWDKYGEYYLNNVKNTINDFYTLFMTLGHKFNYEDKKLLVQRAVGRKKETKVLKLVKNPNMPEDLVDILNSYIILQKLKGQ